MNSIRQIQRLNDAELEKCVPPNASWHTDYRDTAYIHIGGLPFELSEGDVLTVFSQYGNPVHINLVRDKDTGKSRGFAFLKYEDQRSCDLAVDNLSGAGVLGRVLTVDHCRYKLKEGEVEGEGLEDDGAGEVGSETEREDGGRERRKMRRETEDGDGDLDDEDPMKKYLIEQRREEMKERVRGERKRRLERDEEERDEESRRRRRRHRHERDEDGEEERERRRRRRDEDDVGDEVKRHKHSSRKDRDEESPRDDTRERRRRRRDDSRDSQDQRRYEGREHRIKGRDRYSEDKLVTIDPMVTVHSASDQ